MSDPKGEPGPAAATRPATSAATATAETTSTHAETAQRLLAEATRAQARHEREDARADDWGQASFPASDPPQNY